MKKSTLLALVLILIAASIQPTNAQYDYTEDLYYGHPFTYEMGASVGIMNCFTDLGGKEGFGKKYLKDFDAANSQFAGSIYFAVNYNYAIGLRAEATYGRVRASDQSLESVKSTTYGRYERNLSFKSSITELMLAIEIHPRYLFKKYVEGKKLPRFSPYLMGGIGLFSFNPQAKLNGQWIELKPLSTEGQGFAEYPDRKPYKLLQLNFPVGIGIKYKLTPMFNISFEYVSRILNTDYLDDVSTSYIDQNLFANYLAGDKLTNALLLNDRQSELNPAHVTMKGYERGNPKSNDAYFTFNLKMSFVF
jgi:hypothetical protein